MSLVVALRGLDSLIIASESEETVGYQSKRQTNKLVRISGTDWTVVVGGAGGSKTINNAIIRISETLAGKECLSPAHLRDVIDEVLGIVHTKYIEPDPKHEGIFLVGGASIGKELYLFHTEKRITEIDEGLGYVSAGFGQDIAVYWLDRLQFQSFDWEHAVAAAGFILAQAKQSAQFCGGDSQFCVLQVPPNPRWRLPGGSTTMEIDWNQDIQLGSLVTSELEKVHLYLKRDDDYTDEHLEKSVEN